MSALFVLGHMRSYSSLLCHLLGSHPEIDGYCETHIKYRTGFDLLRLRRRVAKLTGERPSGRYVLDKILHDYPLAGSIVRSRSTRAIILVRRPAPTVRSIMNMGLRYSAIPWYRDTEAVARYYEARLASLVRLADRLDARAIWLEAHELVSGAGPVLTRLAAFLALREPLRSSYRKFAHTGEAGYGDPSEEISKGSIGAARACDAHILLPEQLLARLEGAYRSTVAALGERCQSL
jgi:hypothetical protein